MTDFTIAMFLIQHTMNTTLPTLPSVLSPALYASALSLPVPSLGTPRNLPTSPMRQPASMIYAPVTTLSPQMTGQSFSSSQQQQSQQQSAFSSPIKQFQPVQQNPPWDISAQEKAEADKYFAGLDPSNKGVVEGEMALPFMMASRLAVEVLAVVWYVLHGRYSKVTC